MYKSLKKGRSYSEEKNPDMNSMKIVSVSPFRAVVKSNKSVS